MHPERVQDSDERHFVVTASCGAGAMKALGRLDPRRHLAAAIGWSVVLIVSLASLVAANVAADATGRRVRADTERLVEQFAIQIQRALWTNLATRLSIVQATAAQIESSSDRGTDALRRHLEAVQAQFPEFAWVGMADAAGRVVAATGGVMDGEDVSSRPWFQRAQTRPYLGDVHNAVLLDNRLPRVNGNPPRVIDVAAPVADGKDRFVSVIGAQLSWTWIERLLTELTKTLDTPRRIDVLLAAGDGTVLIGPPSWIGRTLGADTDLSEGGAYLVGRHTGRVDGAIDLPWTVVVRQPAQIALAQAVDARRTVFYVVLLAGFVAALAAVAVTRVLTRRLAVLGRDAREVRRGERESLAAPAGADEVADIGAAISELVNHLQREKRALAQLNAELDARVAERTARIERMAEDSRRAAVTRERLRLARDMHDTLAHSLMALLTQIRLVRKLRPRLAQDELDAELGRAEAVAASGLQEARAAIKQMRHNAVQDVGLGPALRELLLRFGERAGVAVAFDADDAAAAMADQRAETVFRIVEEALHNVERHAQAQTVRVGLRTLPGVAAPQADARTRVTVADDGIGFDTTAPHPGHYGLLGMREQAALVGATFDIRSAPGQGTTIELEFAA